MSPLSNPIASRVTAVHVNNLPTEILQEIFILAYLRQIYLRQMMIKADEDYLFPLRLSWVCRFWREATLTYGEFWSYLGLSLNQGFIANHEKVREMFTTFLERTRKGPINFFFHFSFDQPLNEEVRMSLGNMVSDLLKHQKRWRRVDFVWRGLQLPPCFQRREISDMPQLQTMKLDVLLSSNDGGNYPIKININRSKQLQWISLDGSYSFEIGLGQTNAPTNFLVLRNLIALHLKSTNGNPAPSRVVLGDVYLPELRELSYWGDNLQSNGSAILKLIKDSRPPITFLSIHATSVQEPMMIEILRLLPMLVNLDIATCTVTAELMAALNLHRGPGQGAPIVCPELRTLHLTGMPEPGEGPLVPLVMMIESRLREKGTFNKAVICTGGVYDELSFEDNEYTPLIRCFFSGGDIFILTEDEDEDEDDEEDDEEDEEEDED